MSDSATPADRVASAFGLLLARGDRARLHGRLAEGVPGVDPTTYPVLSGLARTGPVTATRLAEDIGLDRTVTTRYATRLEDSGLIARAPDPRDGRATLLGLTEEGEAAIGTMRAALVERVDDVLSSWPIGEARSFADHLDRMLAALTSDLTGDPGQRS